MNNANTDLLLTAHLLRRAGFGATRSELEKYVALGYEESVEHLLHPDNSNSMPDDVIQRFHVDQCELRMVDSAGAYWLYRIITSQCPLEEKMALFWHGLFATGYTKLNQARSLLNQIEMLRNNGLGNFSNLLVELSKDPAMIVWLDNNDNHKDAINENYGRELLELFSMGIGNYTEQDVKECARAFTGWTIGNADYMVIRSKKDSIWPYGRIAWHFDYNEDDHDNEEKTFLGRTGRFNGEDIVEIIATQEITARFISTRLFQFFGADEIDSAGEQVIQSMMESYFDSGYEIRSVLRTLFNSDYFKAETTLLSRVKAPVELMAGAIRLAGSYQQPTLGMEQIANQALFMGQGLLQPPTVEGWHEGTEWVDSGALVERVNFAAKELGNTKSPGIRDIISRIISCDTLTPEELVEKCLDFVGPLPVSENTRSTLVSYASIEGDLSPSTSPATEQRIANMLRLIAASREYQLA